MRIKQVCCMQVDGNEREQEQLMPEVINGELFSLHLY